MCAIDKILFYFYNTWTHTFNIRSLFHMLFVLYEVITILNISNVTVMLEDEQLNALHMPSVML